MKKNSIKISKEELRKQKIKTLGKQRRETDGPIPATKVHSDKRLRRKRNRKEDETNSIKDFD